MVITTALRLINIFKPRSGRDRSLVISARFAAILAFAGVFPMHSVAATGNKAHDTLSAMSADAQALMLSKAVALFGETCSGKSAFFQGMEEKTKSAFWSVRCDGKDESYQVVILADPGGSSTIAECSRLKSTLKISCFRPISEEEQRLILCANPKSAAGIDCSRAARPVASLASATSGTSVMPTGNKQHDKLSSLSADTQALVLSGLVKGCVGTSVFFQGIGKENAAFWSVRCSDGDGYQVIIKADAKGTATVQSCSILKYFTKVQWCFKPLSEFHQDMENANAREEARQKAVRAQEERRAPEKNLCPPPYRMTARDGCQ